MPTSGLTGFLAVALLVSGLLVWRVRSLGRQLSAAVRENAALLRQRLELTKAAAGHAQLVVEREQLENYHRFVPQMQALSSFLNREFLDEMTQARLMKPPTPLLEVVQNLLVKYRAAAREAVRA